MRNLVYLIKFYRAEKIYRSQLPNWIHVQTTAIVPNARKLKVKWTAELADDVASYHTQASINQIDNKMKSEVDNETKT